MRHAIAAAARLMIGVGTVTLLFVAHQLWGTGLGESRAQQELRDQFSAALAVPSDGESATAVPTAAPSSGPGTGIGDGVALLRIPRLAVEKIVVDGVTVEDLKRGPGHYPGTPMPGEPGNVAIAGHRTTYGSPFSRLDELEIGDPILITTKAGEFRYDVSGTQVVTPEAVGVLEDAGDDRLTLTTCHPRFSARQRLVVVAELVGAPAPDATVPTHLADDPVDREADLRDVAIGVSGEAPASRRPAAISGLIAFGVVLGIAALARRWRRWATYALGAPVAAVALWRFFETLALLLPANA